VLVGPSVSVLPADLVSLRAGVLARCRLSPITVWDSQNLLPSIGPVTPTVRIFAPSRVGDCRGSNVTLTWEIDGLLGRPVDRMTWTSDPPALLAGTSACVPPASPSEPTPTECPLPLTLGARAADIPLARFVSGVAYTITLSVANYQGTVGTAAVTIIKAAQPVRREMHDQRACTV
jgi:hypothetical protein